MATSSYKTFLMKKGDTGDAYTKLVDIKDYPDLGGEPEQIETTTLSDSMTTSIPGIQTLESFQFNANYEKEKYAELKALEGKTASYAVWFGGTGEGASLAPTGSEGKYSFEGQLSVFVVGAGVNAVRDMRITILPSTVVTFAAE